MGFFLEGDFTSLNGDQVCPCLVLVDPEQGVDDVDEGLLGAEGSHVPDHPGVNLEG